MSNKIRWGLLSTARINRALLGPIAQSERSELVAIGSRSIEKAKAYANEHNIPKAYGSYEALLADPDIDVIYNSLPNGLHCEWTVKAAQAGKHVLCEKPITVTIEEFDQIEAAAQANQVTIFEAFMYLHHPQTQMVQNMIETGKIGELQLINSWFNFYLPVEHSNNIRLSTDLVGGSLWDVGVYANSLAVVMAQAGPPIEVWAKQTIGETGVEVAIQAQLTFANGVMAQISSGFRTPYRGEAYLVGDKGIIHLPTPWKPALNGEGMINLSLRDGTEEKILPPVVNPYLCEIQAMEACILDGAEPVVPLSLSRNFLKSVLAIYESARTGQVVRM